MKKISLVFSAVLIAVLLGSCTMIPVTKLEAMFRNEQDSTIISSETVNDGNTVTISKAEYEKYLQDAARVEQFSEMFSILDSANLDFYQETDQQKMVEYATRGLMAGLDDPYSYYYNPEEYAQMKEDDNGNYVGIGVLISTNMETGICTIARVFSGGPAEEAGVLRGDILYRVGEDLYVDSTTIDEAVSIMRGLPGTDVDVTFKRGGEEITYTITRREVHVNQVEGKMLEDSIGYIALYQFAGECEKEFENKLNSLIGNGAKGIIIDLRDNPGGWVDQARYIADLFMDQGEVCYLKYRNGESHNDYLTKDGKTDVKLVILINENTASSSEILTGALRDCADAVTVGVKSFGKGIIQGVFPVGDKGAGYQMTIAEYFTPKGTQIHKIGITPDYEVPLPEGDTGTYEFADTEHDIQLIKAVEVMKEAMQ